MNKPSGWILQRPRFDQVGAVQSALPFRTLVTVRATPTGRVVQTPRTTFSDGGDVNRIANNVDPQPSRVWNRAFKFAKLAIDGRGGGTASRFLWWSRVWSKRKRLALAVERAKFGAIGNRLQPKRFRGIRHQKWTSSTRVEEGSFKPRKQAIKRGGCTSCSG
jgi:hypothetical protein